MSACLRSQAKSLSALQGARRTSSAIIILVTLLAVWVHRLCFVQAPRAAARAQLLQPRQAAKQELIELDEYDAWEILDLTPDADKKKIRNRFRRLVATQHPDKRPNDPDAKKKFFRIKQAYEKLMGGTSTVNEMKKWAEENREWSASAREYLGETEDLKQPEAPVLLYVGLMILFVALVIGAYLSLTNPTNQGPKLIKF
eukprot:TRINITY_DN29956_c0_g1_i1.p1 TRINITY_DN29956_c0_g1~~TRINITY_DN29956_c0_g1_i1.p1  ORF type:complete len:215 (+),score=42.79 TRINITY_DN29956_c0_g1_i1:50-646(+)